MPLFICEKCGKIDNSACANNYWHARFNKYSKSEGEEIDTSYKPEFAYFEDHVCCSDCCDGVEYHDGSGSLNKKDGIKLDHMYHWTDYGKEKLLEMEARNDGSMENATEYLKSIGEL